VKPYREARDGGGWRLNRAGREIVAENHGLALYWAWKIYKRPVRNETNEPVTPVADLMSDACGALIYAAVLFDDRHGVPFGAWASRVIGLQMKDAKRRRRVANRLLTFGDDALETVLAPPAPEPLAVDDARTTCNVIRRSIPARSYRMLYLRYVLGWKLAEIGAVEGVCKERVRQVIREAVKWVRAA